MDSKSLVQLLPAAKHLWISTEEVIQRYGFDPLPHSELHSAPDGDYIRSQLVVRRTLTGCVFVRAWIVDDLDVPAKKAADQRATEKIRAIERRITSGYTKGMRKK